MLRPTTAIVESSSWLSDNGPQYTATASVLYAHELGLVPITTPGYSPESNGLAETELRDPETVLAQLGGWFDDYNTQAPHSALGTGVRRSTGLAFSKLLAVSRRLGNTPCDV